MRGLLGAAALCSCPALCGNHATRTDVQKYAGVCVACWVPPPCTCPALCGRTATRTDVETHAGVCTECRGGGAAKIRYGDFFFNMSQSACERSFLCAFPGCSKNYLTRDHVLRHAKGSHLVWFTACGAPAVSEQAAAVAPLQEEQEEEHADATCGHPSTTIDGEEGLDDSDEYICGRCFEPIDGTNEESVGCSTCETWLHLHCSGFESIKAAAAKSAFCYCCACRPTSRKRARKV